MDNENLVDDSQPEPQYSEDEREALRRGKALEDMLRTEGWQVFRKIAEAQIELRKTMLCLPRHLRGDHKELSNAEAEAADEYVKGVLYGISLTLATAEGIVEERKNLLSSQNDGDEE